MMRRDGLGPTLGGFSLIGLWLIQGLGCVPVSDVRVLEEKYAHTLAVKNEVDQQVGGLQNQLATLEKGHGKLVAGMVDEQQQRKAGDAQIVTTIRTQFESLMQVQREHKQAFDQVAERLSRQDEEPKERLGLLQESVNTLTDQQQALQGRLLVIQTQLARLVDHHLPKKIRKRIRTKAAKKSPGSVTSLQSKESNEKETAHNITPAMEKTTPASEEAKGKGAAEAPAMLGGNQPSKSKTAANPTVVPPVPKGPARPLPESLPMPPGGVAKDPPAVTSPAFP